MQLISKYARAVMLTVVVLFLTVGIKAQEFRGTISGAVTDPTGADVPDAVVVIKEIHTGTTTTTKSDAAGQYVVPFLLPGDYTVTVTMPGFQTVTRSGITLQSQEHPILNLSLPIGGTDQTVTVTDAAPLIDQANASVGQIISTAAVADLPLNGRTPTTLTELSEGVITTAPPAQVRPFDNSAGNSWSIGGTPNQMSEVLLDGSPDLTLLGALAYAPTEDSVQEVSVRPFDTDASFGHTIGGVINQITKSGTNALHGTVYEFNQPTNLNANTYFDKRTNPVTRTPGFHFNQYGMTVGGPVIIPKVYNGKDKMFFFFAWEGLKDETPATTYTTVPTANERNGDFSQTLAAGCSAAGYTVNANNVAMCNSTGAPDANQLYNPFTATAANGVVTRTAILNNQLMNVNGPFNPVARAYLNLMPMPTPGLTGAADGQNNYLSNAPAVDNYSNEFGRLDFNLTQRDHLFLDVRHNARTNTAGDLFGNNTLGTTLIRENWGATVDNVYTLNSSTIIDTRFNWTLFNEQHGTPAQAFSPTSVGLPAGMTSASNLVQLPYVDFQTGSSCGSYTSYQCMGNDTSALDPTTSYQGFADIVKVIGRHTVKVGFDGRQYRLSVQNYGNSSGLLNFNSSYMTSGTSGAAQTFGGDMASFMLGLPTSGQYDIEARQDIHSYYFGSFVQDDWRVSNKFTVNLGARFDIDTPFEEKLGKTINGFNPTAPTTVSTAAAAAFLPPTVMANGSSFTLSNINTLGGATYPGTNNGAIYKNNSGFLSPRIGFSYSPQGSTVIRGGFGIFVQPETLSQMTSYGVTGSNANSNPGAFSATTQLNASNNNYLTPATTLSNPFPNGILQPAGAAAGASTFLGQGYSFFAPVEHDPYSERWDLGIQHSLSSNTLLEALYVGNHSLHLPVGEQNINAIKAQYLSTNPYRNQTMATQYGTSVANPFAGLLPNSSGCNGATTALSNLLVPFPQYCSGAIEEENQTIGQSYFNSAILHVEQREKHGLTLTANYSFSKLTEADTFLNDEDTKLTHRISPFDHTHHFTVGGTYDLPFGKGKEFSFGGSRLWNEVLGGIVVNAVYQIQSGQPLVFTSDVPLQPGVELRDIKLNGRNTSPVGSGTPALNTADFVTGNSSTCAVGATCDGSQFFNGQYAFHERTLPQTMSWVRQGGFNNMDASLLKNFTITEKTYFQLRFETFNTLNHAIFAAPNVSSGSASNFGYITSTYATSLPRQVQIGGRFVF